MSQDGKQVRARKPASAKCSGNARSQVVWADLLQRSLAWVVSEKIFEELPRHGNTSWLASELVMLAVLWVWSDRSTLTGALGDAKQLSLTMFGQVALTSYQGFTAALVT